MEKVNYPLCCYFNGEVVVDGENISYKDGVQFFIFIDSNSNFTQLNSLICEELEVDLSQFVVNIKMKFPSVRGYKLISLNSDRSLRAMWYSIYQSKAASMDLYIECIPIEQPIEMSTASCLQSNTSFTNMLTEVMRGSDRIFDESLSANNVDQDQFNDGDEFEENEDLMLLNENEDDDNGEDLVTPSAPSQEFSRLYQIDEDFVNSWHNTSVSQNETGGEFFVGQRFNNKLRWNTCTDLHSYTRKGDGARDYAQDRAFYIQMWDNRMEKTVQPGTRYSGMMSHDDPYLEWFKAITRLVIGPMRQMVYDDYEDHHYYYPTAADYQTLTESNVYTYNTSRRILDDMPDDFPLRHCQAIEKMNAMSLNALRNTNQGHLVNYEEPVEQTPSPPRYNFRHLQQRLIAPTQESIGESSNSRKGKSKRKA